jgi:hypothetical protein
MCIPEIEPRRKPIVSDLMDLIGEEKFSRIQFQGIHRPVLSPSCLHVEQQHRSMDQ